MKRKDKKVFVLDSNNIHSVLKQLNKIFNKYYIDDFYGVNKKPKKCTKQK